MDRLDRDRVAELVKMRHEADPDCAIDPDRMDEYERAAYYQGRLDEYASQNAIDEKEIALVTQDVLEL